VELGETRNPIYRETTTSTERDFNAPSTSSGIAVVDDLVTLPPLAEDEDDSDEGSPRPLSPSVAVDTLNPPLPTPSGKGKGKGKGKSSKTKSERGESRTKRSACDLM